MTRDIEGYRLYKESGPKRLFWALFLCPREFNALTETETYSQNLATFQPGDRRLADVVALSQFFQRCAVLAPLPSLDGLLDGQG